MTDEPRATVWPAAAATGIGSLPFDSPLAAATEVFETFGELPYLPELPLRGVGSDAIGRTAGLLVDLPVELVAGHWQVAARPGTDMAAASRAMDDDLSALQLAAHGYRGPLKVAAVGPLTLLAALGQSRGEAALSDPGLRRDLTASLAEGVRGLLAGVRARVPGALAVLQLDEPSLPAVLAGSLRTRSGWGQIAPVSGHEAQSLLAEVLSATDGLTVVHCCAPDVPLALLTAAGASAASFDLDVVGDGDLDAYAAAVDTGAQLMVGAIPTSRPIDSDQAVERIVSFWRRLGFGEDVMRARTLVSPACGLAGLTIEAARSISRVTAESAGRVGEWDSVGPAG